MNDKQSMLDDWAHMMMSAQIAMRRLDDKLLHKNYDGHDDDIKEVINCMIDVKSWIDRHSAK